MHCNGMKHESDICSHFLLDSFLFDTIVRVFPRYLQCTRIAFSLFYDWFIDDESMHRVHAIRTLFAFFGIYSSNILLFHSNMFGTGQVFWWVQKITSKKLIEMRSNAKNICFL